MQLHVIASTKGLPITPDASRGLTFPINNHGLVYATEELAWSWRIAVTFWASGFALIFLGIVLRYVNERAKHARLEKRKLGISRLKFVEVVPREVADAEIEREFDESARRPIFPRNTSTNGG